VRLTRNCPWNRCAFCPVYKGRKFSRRPADEIKRDIDAAAKLHGDAFTTCFLQDGSSLILSTPRLLEILGHLKERFPSVTRITTYARAKEVLRKSVEDLRALGEAGLSRIHVGLESGSARVLEFMSKGATPGEMVEAGRRVVESGISLSEYVILGLGGREWWEEHATESAKVLNAINPNYIRVRTLRIPDNAPLAEKEQGGEFERLTDAEIIAEERLFIENLEVTSNFASDHSLNLLMEINGRFPDDKEKMLAVTDRFLALGREDQTLFSLGRRMGMLWGLDDFNNEAKAALKKTAERLRAQGYKSIEDAAYALMGLMI
jgi:hypothetical protein